MEWGGVGGLVLCKLEGDGALLFVGPFQHPVVTGPIFKLSILNHIWSKGVDVCLYLSCLASGIKFPSNTSGNCILSSLSSVTFSPLENVLMIFCLNREEIFLALFHLFYFLGSIIDNTMCNIRKDVTYSNVKSFSLSFSSKYRIPYSALNLLNALMFFFSPNAL